MKKIIITTLCSLLFLSGCSTVPSASISGSASGIRVSDGYIEYQDEDGNWQQLISVESLKGEDGADGQDGKDGTDGIDGKNGTNGTNGKDGQNGTNGANGKDGLNGTNGKDGKDGTIVTVNEEGYLVLDGTVTPWKFSNDSSSGYTIDETGSVLYNGTKTGWKVTKEETVTQLPTPVITYCEQVSNTTIGVKWEKLEGLETNSYYGNVYINGEYAGGTLTTGTYRTANIPDTITDEDIEVSVVLYPNGNLNGYSCSEMSVSKTIHVSVNRYHPVTNIQMSEENGTYHFTWENADGAPVWLYIYKSAEGSAPSNSRYITSGNSFDFTPTSSEWYEEGDTEYTLAIITMSSDMNDPVARSATVYYPFTVHRTHE